MWWLYGCFSSPALPPGVLTSTPIPTGSPCDAQDLTIRLTRGDALVEELRFSGSCRGPCTAEERAAAEAEVKRLQEQYEAGEVTASELDYDITTCYSLSTEVDQE